MKTTSGLTNNFKSERAEARGVVLALIFFVAGAAVSGLWFQHARKGEGDKTHGTTDAGLAGGTETVLKQLDSPVELRFYSLLDPANVSEQVRQFSERVDRLLAEYEQSAGGKIKVTRINSLTNFATDAAAAIADGLRPFNQDKGDGSYLGVTVVRNGRKETLAQLSPDWEPALESDLTRAITRASSPPAGVVPPVRTDPSVIEAVRTTVPNLETVSLADGTQLLRDAALNDFKAAVAEMDGQVKAAQQALTQAQNGGSAADQQAAQKRLQEVQAAGAEKIQQIAARSKAQLDALKQLKAGH